MQDFSIFEGFYLDGPMGCNDWSVYLCCGKQAIYVPSSNAEDVDPNITCFCDKHIFLNVKMESMVIKKKKFMLVKASITGYPDVSFIIGQDIANIIRKGFEQDVKINRKSYNNLVQCLSKDTRYEGDNMECITLVQGFVIYVIWAMLAFCGQNVGQNSFSTLLAQLGSGINAYGTKVPCITLRTYSKEEKTNRNDNKRYIKCGESLVKSLTAYKLMLTFDTIHQTLFTCNPAIFSWIQICLLWNRCVRAFFYKETDIEADLSSSMMYGMVMSFSNFIPRDELLLQNKDFKGAKMLPYLGKSSTTPSERPSVKLTVSKKSENHEDSDDHDNHEDPEKSSDLSGSGHSSTESTFITSSFSPSPYAFPISQRRKRGNKPAHLYEF
jgi:hypothetical protein